jgi:hypothetical protein
MHGQTYTPISDRWDDIIVGKLVMPSGFSFHALGFRRFGGFSGSRAVADLGPVNFLSGIMGGSGRCSREGGREMMRAGESWPRRKEMEGHQIKMEGNQLAITDNVGPHGFSHIAGVLDRTPARWIRTRIAERITDPI